MSKELLDRKQEVSPHIQTLLNTEINEARTLTVYATAP